MKVTFPLLLFTVFLVLKLTKVIAWSWWWVTAPLWLGALVAFVILFVVFMFKAYAEAKRS